MNSTQHFAAQGAPSLSREADHRLALSEARHEFRGHDRPAGGDPRAARERISLSATPEVVRVLGSKDTTRKFLFRLADGNLIESVLIPGVARALRRDLRSPHRLRLDAGRLRLRLQILRERSGWIFTQPRRRRDRRPTPRGRGRERREDRQHRLHGHGRTARQPDEPVARHPHHQRAVGPRRSARATSRSRPADSRRRFASWRPSRRNSGSRSRCTARPTKCAAKSCR